ncbi:MAG: hypothetical protein H0T86_09500 [Gemmatimonadales bacterium]|nr:hypothetical protein [Gemmatimonadales bacterium]
MGPRLELFSTLSDARRWQWTGTVRGRIRWESSGDTVLVRGDQLWTRVLRGVPKCGAFGLVGGGIGAVAGQDFGQSSFTGLLTALACAL